MLMYDGLSDSEVNERTRMYGKNELPRRTVGPLALLARQCKGPFNYLLLAAAGISFILHEPIDAYFILFFVLLGAGLSFFQEFKSNSASEKLRSFLQRTITVRRGGVDVELSVEDLVPGDVLRLESGDIVPADAVVRHTTGLLVNETTFTGESVPVAKFAADGDEHEDARRVLQGMHVVRGCAYVEVYATGPKTRFAAIARSVETVHTESDLSKGISKISVFILRATLITLVVVVGANLLIEQDLHSLPTLIIFAIALAVSVVPEALPLVMTFSLSRGSLHLAERGVIVKRLTSIQDLGSIDLLCTDKTGTLTENRLAYRNEYVIPGMAHPLVYMRLAAHDLLEKNPEPFDVAVESALSPEQRSMVERFTLLEEESFDPALRSNGSIVRDADGSELHVRRGSPEYFFAQGIISPSTDTVGQWLSDEERQGRRVLGVSVDRGEGPRFAGFASFEDVLKSSTIDTLARARELDVDITIITGDSRAVAEAVGRQVGLVRTENEVKDATEFIALSLAEQRAMAPDVRVFARTTPEQKLHIITLLKDTHTVGFLGEGINDSPALKAADVSLVVQSASDIARETADIVLVENDLRVIVEGIRFGRETHANTLKYIRTTLVSNFGNFYAVAISSLFITFLPMLPKQLLLLNLLSDFPMMAIAFDRVSSVELRKPQRYDFKGLYITFFALGMVSTVFDFLYFGIFYTISPEVLHTNWFIASVLTEILLLFSIRSYLPMHRAGMPAPCIIWLSVMAFVVTVTLPFVPAAVAFFEFTTPTLPHMALIIGLALLYLVVSEVVKLLLHRTILRD